MNVSETLVVVTDPHRLPGASTIGTRLPVRSQRTVYLMTVTCLMSDHAAGRGSQVMSWSGSTHAVNSRRSRSRVMPRMRPALCLGPKFLQPLLAWTGCLARWVGTSVRRVLANEVISSSVRSAPGVAARFHDSQVSVACRMRVAFIRFPGSTHDRSVMVRPVFVVVYSVAHTSGAATAAS